MGEIRFHLRIPKIPLLSPRQALEVQQAEYAKGMLTLVQKIAGEARRRVPVATGLLKSSILNRVEVSNSGPIFVKGIVSTDPRAPYAYWVEHGSRPHWAPIAPLKAWARKVLGNERAAYAVQRAIAKRGTRAQPFMEPAFEAVRPEIVPVMTAARDRVVQRLGTPG